MKKRLFCLFLALALVIALVPAQALATDSPTIRCGSTTAAPQNGISINVEADSFVEAYDKLSCELAKHDDGEITAEDLYMAMCELHDWMAAKIN